MLQRFIYRSRVFRLLAVALFVLPGLIGTASPVAASHSGGGAVYTLTNSASGNAVQEFERAADGNLSAGGAFDTGGLGTGGGLGSQGAIALSDNNRWLFAVNAGSNDISVFAVQPGQLSLVDRVSSEGSTPISLTYHEGLLYVLNAGNGGNIAGFHVGGNGHLRYIRNSSRFLSNNGVGSAPSPEQIGFSPDGKSLVVAEKGSNLIDTYRVKDDKAEGPVVNTSNGAAPYGFGFSGDNILVISEAANSAVSSYKVNPKGLKVVTPSLVDTQGAACWLVVTQNGRYAYAANAASGTISGYRVAHNGSLDLLSASGVDGDTGAGSHPIDMSIDRDGQFLYVLAAGTQSVDAFSIGHDGSLSFIGAFDALGGTSGLAAR